MIPFASLIENNNFEVTTVLVEERDGPGNQNFEPFLAIFFNHSLAFLHFLDTYIFLLIYKIWLISSYKFGSILILNIHYCYVTIICYRYSCMKMLS